MKCPKCGVDCLLTHKAKHDGRGFDWDEHGRLRPADPFEGPIAVFRTPFRELWSCTTHGEFGIKDDGSAEFVHPDTWVEGPNGEKLFRF